MTLLTGIRTACCLLPGGFPATIASAAALAVLTPLAVAAQSNPPANAPRVPLRAGLTVVTAVNQPEQGDYESIKVIVDDDARQVRLKYSTDVPEVEPPDDPLAALFGGGKPQAAKRVEGGKTRQIHATRVIARGDLDTATEYRLVFSEQQPESFPGSTAIGVSRRVLTDLKTKGESPLSVPPGGLAGGLAGLIGGLLGTAAKELDMETMMSGTLKRVDPNPVPFKVLLNDLPVELPAVHARGTLGEEAAEFWILDDADNPLALKWTIGDDRLQVIRLSYPVTATAAPDGGSGRELAAGAGKPPGAGAGGSAGSGTGIGGGASPGAGVGSAAAGTATRIEADLAKTGRSVIYGIYFDFASDRIKEESEPVLAEIAQVLRQNPTWNLSVEGHTDNIASDPYNLDLSQRRAAAVKAALTGRYKIAGGRLSTAGFGESSPKDTNATLEGRARNRRVELVKSN
jgi:outer membrane protein OmpA-like peptidoglycan-associated protein